MTYSTIVEKNEEGLNLIIEAAEKFNKQQILSALYECNLTQEKVIQLTHSVRETRVRMNREHLALAKFALKFNQLYATDNNKCFETAERLFNRVRSSVSGAKRIYKRFCKPNRKRYQGREPFKPSVFKRSQFVADYRCGMLFGLGCYNDSVEELYDELEAFFVELIKILALCHTIIEEEKAIRRSPEASRLIYKECYNQMVKDGKVLTSVLRTNNAVIPVDEFTLRKSKAKKMDDFYCTNYHTLNTEQFSQHVLCTELNDARKNGLTDIEKCLWGSDYDKARQARFVVDHFDELEPEGHKGKLSGYAVAAFMSKFGIGCADKKVKMFVEEYFNPMYRGMYNTLKANTVDNAKNKIETEEYRYDVLGFNKKIDNLLARYC